VAVFDDDPQRAAKNADQVHAPVVDDLDGLLGDEQLDAVIVCSETDRHESLVLRAAAAGKHLFVEKPLGFATEDAFRMAAAVEKAGVIYQTGYFLRGTPIHRKLKTMVDAGDFGTITRVRHSNCHNGSLGGWFDTDWRWMADPKRAGCGAFGDLGTHSLDILMWLFGPVQRVAADVRVVTGRYEDCDEVGEAMLAFEAGPLATLAGSWVDLANPLQLLISGTEAHAAVFNGQLYIQSESLKLDGSKPVTDLPAAWPHAFHLFLDAVGGKPDVPLVSVREAAMRSSVMDAVYQAVRSQTWIQPRQYA
jgi:1,5-anhydro-D-fructose reductase (1,5-anhydro-D-mannitol-forming)